MVVKKMIKEAKKECKEDPPPLPLIRLRVEHTEFESFNTQRFGQQFVGKVANPKDILHFHRKRSSKSTAKPAVNTAGVRGRGSFLLFFSSHVLRPLGQHSCRAHITRCAGSAGTRGRMTVSSQTRDTRCTAGRHRAEFGTRLPFLPAGQFGAARAG